MNEMENLIIMSGPNRELAVKRLLREGHDYEEVMKALHSLQKRGLAAVKDGFGREFRNEFDQKYFAKAPSIRQVYQDTRKPLHGCGDTRHPRVLRWDDGLYRNQKARGIFACRAKTPVNPMAGRWSTVPGCDELGGARSSLEEFEERKAHAERLRRGGDQ